MAKKKTKDRKKKKNSNKRLGLDVAKAIKEEAEVALDSGKGFTMSQHRRIMKLSGLGLAQVIKATNQELRRMQKAREEAILEGNEFSELAYLKNEMDAAEDIATVQVMKNQENLENNENLSDEESQDNE